MKKTITCIIITLLLIGCVSSSNRLHNVLYDQQIQQGQSTSYSIGFADGSISGRHDGGGLEHEFIKDIEQYRDDEEYKTGWDAGFAAGKGEMETLYGPVK
jgi:hypothetical protein